ncbi:MAG: N-acetylglucosamine-6-phosphate deacetylase [Planctomycetes bacterium]|nr:N-acetylglucosamine-6-phosphate deacetylase [Planctomycetota bacterium]
MTREIVIAGGTLYTSRMRLEGGSLVVDGRRIRNVLAAGEESAREKGCRVIDATGCIVASGFIDIHVHGGGGGDTSQRDPDAVCLMSRTHARFGTTAMLPTIYPGPLNEMIGAIDAVEEAMKERPLGAPGPRRGDGGVTGLGARILGINMEGPFLNPAQCGALKPEHLMEPSEDVLLELIAASDSTIRLMSIAPELPGAIRLIKACRDRGIRTAVGHSDASHEEMILGINAGINHVTHVFNALRRTHHRDPGVMGTILINDEITVELIADFYHVHPAVVVLLIKVKPNDKIALITDALTLTGLDGDTFQADGREVKIIDSVARLADGTIAGSVLTMNRAVRNMVSTERVPVGDALRMASLVPAKILGIEHSKGTLTPGSDADIVIMDDDFNVKLTMVEGEIIYRSEDF